MEEETKVQICQIRFNLDRDDLDRKLKSGVVFKLFIPRLDERVLGEICLHTVTRKCVQLDVFDVCMAGG